MDILHEKNDNHKKSSRKRQDKLLKSNPTKKGSTSSTSQSTLSRSRSSERRRKSQQKKSKKKKEKSKKKIENRIKDVTHTQQSNLVARHDDDDDGSSIGVPVIGEFILEVETFCDDPFANSDLKLPEPKPKRADRFRKERIDNLLTTMKKEHISKRSLQDIDILNGDNQESGTFNDGHYQTTSTKDLKSQMTKLSSSACSIRSPLNNTSGFKSPIAEMKKKQNQMHVDLSAVKLSKRTRERNDQSINKNISIDRRSSVRDSLSYFLESSDEPIYKKEQMRDAAQFPFDERHKNLSRSSRSVSSCPGVTRKKGIRDRSRSRPRSRRQMLGPMDSRHNEVQGLAQSCRKLNLAF